MNNYGKVSIVMSVYEPDLIYFEKCLKSLNDQDYENVELIMWDDCENTTIDTKIFDRVLTNISYKYIRCDKNLGCVKAFERLTTIAEGDYISYCDQDDIWLPSKISKCVEELNKNNAIFACCSYAIIDGDDNIICDDALAGSGERCKSWKTGDNITKYAVFECFAAGFSILMRSDAAKNCVPFSNYFMHDKWITSCASAMGKMVKVDEPLAQYRRHGKNVSGTLNNIKSKNDYYRQRVSTSYKGVMEFVEKFPDVCDRDEIKDFAIARKNRKILGIWKHRNLAKREAMFEVFLCIFPGFVVKFALNILKKK